MGRHAAGDGAAVHPLVAAALEQRPTPGAPSRPRHLHSAATAADERQGGLGWPGEPGDGTGLGWPAAGESGTADAVSPAEPSTGHPAGHPPVRRRGWRRLFGGGTTTPESERTRDSTAA